MPLTRYDALGRPPRLRALLPRALRQAYAAELEAFVDAVRGRPVTPTGEDGLAALKVALAATESARRGGADPGALGVKAQEIVHPDPIWEAGGCETPTLPAEARMNIHQNARTTPHSRAEIVRRVTEDGNRSAAWRRRSGCASARPANGRRSRTRRPACRIARAGRTVAAGDAAGRGGPVAALRRARWTGARIAPRSH